MKPKIVFHGSLKEPPKPALQDTPFDRVITCSGENTRQALEKARLRARTLSVVTERPARPPQEKARPGESVYVSIFYQEDFLGPIP